MNPRTKEALIAILVAAIIAAMQEAIKFLSHTAIGADTQAVSSGAAGLTYYVRMLKYIV